MALRARSRSSEREVGATRLVARLPHLLLVRRADPTWRDIGPLSGRRRTLRVCARDGEGAMNATDPIPPTVDVSTSEISALYFCRFLGLQKGEPVELVALYPGKAWPRVAYATSREHMFRLMREGDETTGIHGVYVIANRIDPAIAARYELNQWHKSENGRATDSEILERRVLYIDVDSERPRGISSTDEEKKPCYAVVAAVEDFLRQALGDPQGFCLGRGDSGNGLSVFVALEPAPPSKDSTERVGKFLRALNLKFGTDRVKIDGSVANPARLVPMFGTRKRKGANTPERPHRLTYFTCRPEVARVPLEAIA